MLILFFDYQTAQVPRKIPRHSESRWGTHQSPSVFILTKITHSTAHVPLGACIGYQIRRCVGSQGQGEKKTPRGGGGVSARLVYLRDSGRLISELKGLSAAGAKIYRRRRRRENFEVFTHCPMRFLHKTNDKHALLGTCILE